MNTPHCQIILCALSVISLRPLRENNFSHAEEELALADQRADGPGRAAADATEEAILNALCAAETMTGRAGHVAPALPLERLVEVMARYGR